jgi:urease subunit beta
MKYKIGEIIYRPEEVEVNCDKDAVELMVKNTGDRTIQVCSHYHFFECNSALTFDRPKAYGMRLDIPSGNAMRFEPGEDKIVRVVPFGGERKIYGFAGLTMGALDDVEVKEAALKRLGEDK